MLVQLRNTDDTIVADVEVPTGVMETQIYAAIVYKGDVYINTAWPGDGVLANAHFRYVSSHTIKLDSGGQG